jgi:hypothetical protein
VDAEQGETAQRCRRRWLRYGRGLRTPLTHQTLKRFEYSGTGVTPIRPSHRAIAPSSPASAGEHACPSLTRGPSPKLLSYPQSQTRPTTRHQAKTCDVKRRYLAGKTDPTMAKAKQQPRKENRKKKREQQTSQRTVEPQTPVIGSSGSGVVPFQGRCETEC